MMDEQELDLVRAAVRAEIAVDPRSIGARVARRMLSDHGWTPTAPLIARCWREVVESGGGSLEVGEVIDLDAIEAQALADSRPSALDSGRYLVDRVKGRIVRRSEVEG